MYPFGEANVPIGVDVPQVGNLCLTSIRPWSECLGLRTSPTAIDYYLT